MKQLVTIAILLFSVITYAQGKPDYYALQTYRISSLSQEASVDQYLKEAYLPVTGLDLMLFSIPK